MHRLFYVLAAFTLLIAPAFSAMMTTWCCGSDGSGSANPPGGVFWNPADKDSSIVLTNTNTTATQSGASSAFRSVRSVTSHASGKYYYECQNIVTDAQNGWIGGVGNGSASLTTYPGQLGTTGNGFQSDGGFYDGSGHAGVWAGATSTHNVSFAIDVTGGLIWVRKDGGTWNTAGDPVAGTGGSTITATGALFAMWAGFDGSAADACTLGTVNTYTPPTGYVVW